MIAWRFSVYFFTLAIASSGFAFASDKSSKSNVNWVDRECRVQLASKKSRSSVTPTDGRGKRGNVEFSGELSSDADEDQGKLKTRLEFLISLLPPIPEEQFSPHSERLETGLGRLPYERAVRIGAREWRHFVEKEAEISTQTISGDSVSLQNARPIARILDKTFSSAIVGKGSVLLLGWQAIHQALNSQMANFCLQKIDDCLHYTSMVSHLVDYLFALPVEVSLQTPPEVLATSLLGFMVFKGVRDSKNRLLENDSSSRREESSSNQGNSAVSTLDLAALSSQKGVVEISAQELFEILSDIKERVHPEDPVRLYTLES